MDYDLFVIGGGPAGYTAALRAAGYGLKTALAEKDQIGGTCLNRGCIPTKTLLHGTELLREVRESDVFAVKAEADPAKLTEKKDKVVSSLREGIEKQLAAKKIDVFHAEAVIRDSHAVLCEDREITAEHILIATGSVVSLPPVEGIELPGVITSDDLFRGSLPQAQRLVIVGGGVIGTEIASIYRELGTKVTILEYMPYLLPLMDRDFGRSLQMIFKKRGIDVICGAKVERIEQKDGLTCVYQAKGKELSVSGDLVLVCTGRKAAADRLFADPSLIQCDRGIVVDENFETSLKNVSAVGDVISGSIKLAHAASAQAASAVSYIAGRKKVTDPSVIPACVYTSPEIASVGMTAEEAKQKGISAFSKKVTMFANGRTVIADGERGWIKIVFDQDGVLLGAQLMCERASDLIGMFTEAAVNRMTVSQLASAVMPHPSFVEAVQELFEEATLMSSRA